MAIYSRIGVKLTLTSARLVDVWIENTPHQCKWHYAEPKKVGKRSKIDTMRVWHATAEYAEVSKDGSCQPGMKVWGGREEPEGSFVADDGWQEVRAEFYRLNPADAAKEQAILNSEVVGSNEQTAIPEGLICLALTANFWGAAQTEQGALRKVRDAGGKQALEQHGYVLYHAHPETEVTELGGFRHPKGKPPVKIADHRINQ